MMPCLALLCVTLVPTANPAASANPAKAGADLMRHRTFMVNSEGWILSGEKLPEGSVRTLRGPTEGEVLLAELQLPQSRQLFVGDHQGPLTLLPGEKVLLRLPDGKKITKAGVYPEGLLKLTAYDDPTMVWATAIKKGAVHVTLIPAKD